MCACMYVCGRFGGAGLEAAFAPRQRKPRNVCGLRNEGTRVEVKGSVPVRRTDRGTETRGTERGAQEDLRTNTSLESGRLMWSPSPVGTCPREPEECYSAPVPKGGFQTGVCQRTWAFAKSWIFIYF